MTIHPAPRVSAALTTGDAGFGRRASGGGGGGSGSVFWCWAIVMTRCGAGCDEIMHAGSTGEKSHSSPPMGVCGMV